MDFRLILLVALLPASALSQPLAGSLVWTANTSGNWDMFLLRAGESSPVQLTRTSLDERAPSISPDGKKVAYATSDGALWVLDLAAPARPQRLALPKGIYGFPAWLPDASGIVYTKYEYHPPEEDADLFVFRFKTNKQEIFVMQTGPQDHPSVSPSGDRVAYFSSVATTLPGFGSTVTQQLWVADLRTGKPTQLFFGSARDTRPAWSKDGKRLAFASDRSGNQEIWVMDGDGQASSVQITNGPGAKSSPTWSPDGSEIAHVSTASGRSELYIVRVATKESRKVALFGSKTVEVRDPDWR